jgi:exosortase
MLLLGIGIGLRWVGGLAIELFTMRMGATIAGMGLVVFTNGWKQLRHWWLPASLVILSIPLPSVVISSLALPLQLKASEWGAALLAWRSVPVRLAGNVILLPGRSLFVTEACSGLRSLTALLAVSLVAGGLWLRTSWARLLLLVLAIPMAMAINSVRIFLTGFLVYFVSPEWGEGLMHYSEGWALFLIGLVGVAAIAAGLRAIERLPRRRSGDAAATSGLQ